MSEAPSIIVDFAVSQSSSEQVARYRITYGPNTATLELPVRMPPVEEAAADQKLDLHRAALDEFQRRLAGAIQSGRIRWRERHDLFPDEGAAQG